MGLVVHPEAHSALRPRKAAELLDVSVSKVYSLMASGELPWFPVGDRGRRIRLADLQAYMTQRIRNRDAS